VAGITSDRPEIDDDLPVHVPPGLEFDCRTDLLDVEVRCDRDPQFPGSNRGGDPFERSRRRLRPVRRGDSLLIGVFSVAGSPGSAALAGRLLDLLMDGLRPVTDREIRAAVPPDGGVARSRSDAP